MKTSDLIGPALDWAVAKCEGRSWPDNAAKFLGEQYYRPSTDWSQGGPIIERELINLNNPFGQNHDNEEWVATWKFGGFEEYLGPTPLIAAMRCYVANKLGETVEVPDELIS